MRTNLKEKVAFVTGASSGLGARFARVLAANGALTVLAARRVERLKDLRAEIEAEGGAATLSVDVTQPTRSGGRRPGRARGRPDRHPGQQLRRLDDAAPGRRDDGRLRS
jgi:NAD(P)-dependent dehydrogenase (short-subunit alcohol dehydrogenase family)